MSDDNKNNNWITKALINSITEDLKRLHKIVEKVDDRQRKMDIELAVICTKVSIYAGIAGFISAGVMTLIIRWGT